MRFENREILHDNGDKFFAVWDTQEQRFASPRFPAKGSRVPGNPNYPDEAWFFVQELTIQFNTMERNKKEAEKNGA